LLAASDQAIKRVLANPRATQQQQTEALSLTGRNAKTRWREVFESLKDIPSRRQAAINAQLLEAYCGYLKAYSGDLNHYWSGIAALQMCTIAQSLAGETQWEDMFDDAQKASDKKAELALSFDRLKGAVKLAVSRAKNNAPNGSNDRIWAEISNAAFFFSRKQAKAG
jgi:hypothetical protein